MLLAAAAPPPHSGLLGSTAYLFDIISVLLLLAGAAAAIWAFRTRRSTIEIQNYKDLAESYERVSKAQKAQIEELQTARKKEEEKVRLLQAKLDALSDIVTGRTALEEFSNRVERSFGDVTAKMARLDAMNQFYHDLKSGQVEIIAKLDWMGNKLDQLRGAGAG